MKKYFSLFLMLILGTSLLVAAQELSPKTSKVVIVSLDAAADWLVDDFLARGVLTADGAFGRMARNGARAEAMLPVAPSMTAPSHISMFTGAYPERTGIVSNWFLPPGGRISRRVNGFNAAIEAETLWHAAMRQGKRVICATAVGADNSTPDRNCDLTFAYGSSVGGSSVIYLEPAQEGGSTQIPGGFEHAVLLWAKRDSPSPLGYPLGRDRMVEVYAWAVDRISDGEKRFDAVVLDFDRSTANGFAAVL